ncbi:hypothetical protein KJ713_03400 [Patescibacteria group bacterium]|nr:hypothetical protein [Patescibacteria group bacterium]
MSVFSSTIQLRLTAPIREDPDGVWKKAQEAIAGVIGEDRLKELLESGKLKREDIEVRPVYEFDRETKQQTGDLVGIIDFDIGKGDHLRIGLRFSLGLETYQQVVSALNQVVLSRLQKDEIVFDPVSQIQLLREEAQGFLNGYLRQAAELASTLAGEPVVLVPLTAPELDCISSRRQEPVGFEADVSARRILQEAAKQLAQTQEEQLINHRDYLGEDGETGTMLGE